VKNNYILMITADHGWVSLEMLSNPHEN
jgi:hypothetical protein